MQWLFVGVLHLLIALIGWVCLAREDLGIAFFAILPAVLFAIAFIVLGLA